MHTQRGGHGVGGGRTPGPRRAVRRWVGGVGAAAALLTVATGCGDAGPGPGLEEEIRTHRAMWEAARPLEYEYTVERLCFCPETARGPVRVAVRGAAVAGRWYRDGSEVPPERAEWFPPVDGLFDVLLDAVARDADVVEVTWAPDTGVPLDIWIDYRRTMADEELGFRVVEAPR